MNFQYPERIYLFFFFELLAAAEANIVNKESPLGTFPMKITKLGAQILLMELDQNSELYLKRATRVATACSKSVGPSVKVGKIRQSLLLLALLQVEELALN